MLAVMSCATQHINSKNTISIHESLSAPFKNLYKYTSGNNGIRHALHEEANVTFTEARFMLIACSAFVNYLVSKADEANIQFS